MILASTRRRGAVVNIRAILGFVLILLLVLVVGIWLGRSGGVLGTPARPAPTPPVPALPVSSPAVPPASADDPADPANAAPIRSGDVVEALSAEGWQYATVLHVEDSEALLDYSRGDLPEERLDLRLLRQPEARPSGSPSPRQTTPTVAARSTSPTATQPDRASTGQTDLRVRDVPDGTFLGCFHDTNDFDLAGHLEAGTGNTPQRCVARCRSLGFAFAGVQNGLSCLCGNSYGRYGHAEACFEPCSEDPAQSCGGFSTYAVYATGLEGKRP